MQILLGAWASKVVSDVARLNIPDVLKQQGPLSAAELVSRHGIGARPDSLERALRACASFGIFVEHADGSFAPTEFSDVLTSDSPVSVKKLADLCGSNWYWKAWSGFSDALATGEPQIGNQLGIREGTIFDFLNANPVIMADFGEAMKSNSLNSMRGVLKHCDFTASKKVVDVGGGFGHLVVALLGKYPSLRGVLVDLPNLILIAQQSLPVTDRQVASRLEYFGGNMFEAVPAADVYVMKHILHDWDDERCVRLLRNCHQSMEGGGRLICVDSVLPPMGDTTGTAAKLLDLNMMVMLPGKERTRVQWEELYQKAGFTITNITPLADNFGTSIVEGAQTRLP
jgi:hypothetical protein